MNPRDGALLIATHHGLYRVAPDQRRALPHGERRPDVMGFSVVGPDHVIGSGHPDPRDRSAPPNLGLVSSRDAGRTFDSVSLRGEADFHVLEAGGERVYGYDASNDRLMASRNGGQRWTRRQAPAPMFALASDPRDPGRIVAATSGGLQTSVDEGRSWDRAPRAPVGLLTWPKAEALYVADQNGEVHLSADGGRTFRRVGTTQVQPVALAGRGEELLAALADGTILLSNDGARTWRFRASL